MTLRDLALAYFELYAEAPPRYVLGVVVGTFAAGALLGWLLAVLRVGLDRVSHLVNRLFDRCRDVGVAPLAPLRDVASPARASAECDGADNDVLSPARASAECDGVENDVAERSSERAVALALARRDALDLRQLFCEFHTAVGAFVDSVCKHADTRFGPESEVMACAAALAPLHRRGANAARVLRRDARRRNAAAFAPRASGECAIGGVA